MADYKKNKQKAPSAAAPFELMDVRLYKTERKVGQITKRVPFPPMDDIVDGDQIFVFNIQVRCFAFPTLFFCDVIGLISVPPHMSYFSPLALCSIACCC